MLYPEVECHKDQEYSSSSNDTVPIMLEWTPSHKKSILSKKLYVVCIKITLWLYVHERVDNLY